ncbi:uroporphyrinogen-III synthase [bacterium]|nr:uroporphyrinogen-III synthase [bacterium]
MKILLTSSPFTVEKNKETLDKSKIEFLYFKTIEFKPIRKTPFDLKEYEWVIISSRSVYHFLSPLVKKEDWTKVKIAAVGEATSRYLRENNLEVEFVSSVFTGKAFAKEFINKYPSVKGKILRPVSSLASSELDNILKEAGMKVERVPLYKTVCPRYSSHEVEDLKKKNFKGIVFTSPSSWENFKKIMRDNIDSLLKQKVIAVLGPSTARALEKDGYTDYIMPSKYTLSHLITKMEGELS